MKGNHTYKTGGEYRLNSWTDINAVRSQGSLGFDAQQTGLPSLQGVNLGGGNVGFPYASFLLGAVNTASVKAVQDPQWRKASLSLFAQDTWKITRKLTLDYGLRWDYAGKGMRFTTGRACLVRQFRTRPPADAWAVLLRRLW